MFAEVINMRDDITLLQSPIITDIGEWVMNNSGLVAIANRLPDNKAEICAIEKASVAPARFVKYAKDNNAMILVGVSEGEVNAID